MSDPSALNFHTFDSDFPLCTNCLALTIGGTGSGKSFFTYNFFLPIYAENFGVQWLIICSKTAGCDATLRAALAKNNVEIIIDPDISRLFTTTQEIRAQALKMDFLEQIYKSFKKGAQSYKHTIEKIKHEVTQLRTYPVMQQELRDFLATVEAITDEDNYVVIVNNANFDDTAEGRPSEDRYLDRYASKIIRDDRKALYDHFKVNATHRETGDSEVDNYTADGEDPLSSEDDNDACIQMIELENPVAKKIAQDNKYDDKESDPEPVTLELNFGVVLKRKAAKNLQEKLVHQRILYNLTNFAEAAKEVYGAKYQPVLIIVDDNAVSSELSNQNSRFTQLCLTRRHLHCNVNILVQGVTYLNTSLRRNATSYHLLPTISEEDLKLIEKRLPKGLMEGELAERYIANTRAKDRTQRMTHIFIASNPPVIVDGLPDCALQYKI